MKDRFALQGPAEQKEGGSAGDVLPSVAPTVEAFNDPNVDVGDCSSIVSTVTVNSPIMEEGPDTARTQL